MGPETLVAIALAAAKGMTTGAVGAGIGIGSAAIFKPSSTGLVEKVEEEVLPIDDDAEKARISAQRRSLDKLRRGRQSLRVDLTKNPGVASTGNSGIRIPE